MLASIQSNHRLKGKREEYIYILYILYSNNICYHVVIEMNMCVLSNGYLRKIIKEKCGGPWIVGGAMRHEHHRDQSCWLTGQIYTVKGNTEGKKK